MIRVGELSLRSRVRIRMVDWEKLHFCRENKVKYRKHLTCWMVVVTVLSIVGVTFGIVWLCHAATLLNAWTAVMWIWE